MTHYRFDDYGNELPPIPKTITEINNEIKSLIEEEAILQDVYAVGEISNYKKHSTGHLYLTLKDEFCEIRAVMFRTYAQKMKFVPENGMRVIVHARIGVYPQNGSYQMYIDSMQPDGVGSLHLAFEQLKSKLEREGLFDIEHKKDIPYFPLKIGVITSPTGAAIRDIIKVTTQRCPLTKIILFPSLVQGENAAQELILGVEYFNIEKSVDVIIIGRGGGSIEDLWPFNDEDLARAVYKSEIPIISAVGHEIDFTLCDFVADIRAATPSHAAELATPNCDDIKNTVNFLYDKLLTLIESQIQYKKSRIKDLESSKVLQNPLAALDIPKLRLISLENSLISSFSNSISKNKQRFLEANSKLIALNPMSILSRGYGAVLGENNNIIKSIDDVNKNDTITVKLSDGKISALVLNKSRGGK